MERISLSPRPNWQQKCHEIGFHFHSLAGPYWQEEACYHLTSTEVDELELATEELQQICLTLVREVIEQNRFQALGIPPLVAQRCRRDWEKADPSLYGRFDLMYDGTHPPKLLEYNADTPTALLEASVVQWVWLQDVLPHADQFNSIHEKLLTALAQLSLAGETLYFTSVRDSVEDLGTVEYLRDVAIQAGLATDHLFVEEIGWDPVHQYFCDLDEQPIRVLFKLYPWEWLVIDDFGEFLIDAPLTVIEPAWKLILSNKAMLPLLWERFPNHPNLLPASFTPLPRPFVQKPFFSREGANITIQYTHRVERTPGPYGQEGMIYQAHCPPAVFSGHYPVIGSWVIGGSPAGIGIRESQTPITQNNSRFVPHYFT